MRELGVQIGNSGLDISKKAIATKMSAHVVCPQCTSIETQRSRLRGVVFERFVLPLFSFRLYRCNRCDKRFYSKVRKSSHTEFQVPAK